MYKVVFQNGRVLITLADTEGNALRKIYAEYPDLHGADIWKVIKLPDIFDL